MKPFWLVWNPAGKAPTYKHPTKPLAEQEAERLARLNKGETFHVLQAIANCKVQDIFWEHCEEGQGIPF